MIGKHIESFVFKRVAPRNVRHIKPVSPQDAAGLVKQVYRQMERDFQIAPPITIHSLDPELLAGIWCGSRECLVAGPADRVTRELVAATISRINACPYCVDVHGMMLEGAGQKELAKGVFSDGKLQNSDPWVRGIIEWASATRSPTASNLAHPPFADVDRPQVFGTAVVFHYINRVVNVFMDESPMPIRLSSSVKQTLGSVMTSRIVAVVGTPGESLGYLADAPLPPELSWAKLNPSVAGGLARMNSAVGKAGARFVPGNVRELVKSRAALWRGEDIGLSRAWVEEAIGNIDPSDRAHARLALLAAFASHQVDDGVIHSCRAAGLSDTALLATVSWSAFEVALRIGSWLAPNSTIEPTNQSHHP